MDTPTESRTGIKNNKGKFVVLILYVLFVLIAPLQYLIPTIRNQQRDFLNSLVAKDTDDFFMQYFALLHNGDAEKAYAFLSPKAQQSVTPESMSILSTHFASSTSQMHLVGANINHFTNEEGTKIKYDVYYEIQSNDPTYKYLVAEIVAEDEGSGLQILGTHITFEKESAEVRARFNFGSQSIYLILAILIPIFIAYTAFRYITKAKNPKWIVFLVILFVTLYLQITNQSVRFNFGFYGFMNKTSPFSQWVFLTPAPLGAVYYYLVRKKYENPKQQSSAVDLKI